MSENEPEIVRKRIAEPADLVDLNMLAARLVVSQLSKLLERMTDYLEEAHEPDKETTLYGLKHAGDGDSCSYCRGIEASQEMLKIAKTWMEEMNAAH